MWAEGKDLMFSFQILSLFLYIGRPPHCNRSRDTWSISFDILSPASCLLPRFRVSHLASVTLFFCCSTSQLFTDLTFWALMLTLQYYMKLPCILMSVLCPTATEYHRGLLLTINHTGKANRLWTLFLSFWVCKVKTNKKKTWPVWKWLQNIEDSGSWPEFIVGETSNFPTPFPFLSWSFRLQDSYSVIQSSRQVS